VVAGLRSLFSKLLLFFHGKGKYQLPVDLFSLPSIALSYSLFQLPPFLVVAEAKKGKEKRKS